MLTISTRDKFETLLDAVTLQTDDDASVLDTRPALVFVSSNEDPIQISRPVFRRAVEEAAVALYNVGLKGGDLVIIAHNQNLESVYFFWGALQVGAIPSMFPTLTEKLDPQIYLNNLQDLVRLSNVKMVLSSDEFAADISGHLDCPVLGTSRLLAKNDLEVTLKHRPSPQDTAFVQHSSGTTGLQKGVAVTHEAVLNQLANTSHVLELAEDDVIVSWLPLYHDMGLIAGFLLPLMQGTPLILMSPFDWVRHPVLLFKAIEAFKGTLCWLPNFAYNHCTRRIRQRDLAGLDLSSMRLFINCSEPVRADSHHEFRQRLAPFGLRPEMLGVSYAMAENTFAVTQSLPRAVVRQESVNRRTLEENGIAELHREGNDQAVTMVSCGPAIPGTVVRVVDGEGRPLPERCVGEIAIRSDCLLQGYYRRPDLNPFNKGWFMTGDRGYIADNEIYIVGRSKDLIINAGKNIYPQDIEAIVNGIDGVHPGRVVAFGAADEQEGTELIAIVVETNLEEKAGRLRLKKEIRQLVSRQSMVTVSYVDLVPPRWLLKTSSGKIARRANHDKWKGWRQTRLEGAANRRSNPAD